MRGKDSKGNGKSIWEGKEEEEEGRGRGRGGWRRNGDAAMRGGEEREQKLDQWKLNEALIEATDAKLKQEQEQKIALNIDVAFVESLKGGPELGRLKRDVQINETLGDLAQYKY
ncbi:hypothetical protein Trihar35433_9931 [Trichoderma harzianum]|nr:hypothetical protein Trihar35433_9931 [Trichoderma harzianum]